MIDPPTQPFTQRDLETLGLSYGRLRTHLRAGRLVRSTSGVYVSADLPDTPALRARCAALVLEPHQVVSDHSAAWIHGVAVFERSLEAMPYPPLLTTVAVGGHDRTRRSGTLGGKRDLRPEDICTIEGIRVTTPLRTACDLASLRGRRTALATVDSFLHERLITHDELLLMLPRYARRRGVIQLRDLAAIADGRAESPGESWTRLELHDRGLRLFTPQVWAEVPGVGRYRLDLANESLKVAVEYDGVDFHTSADQRERDAFRRTALVGSGWVIVVVGKDDFTSDQAVEAWVRDVRAAVEGRPTPGKRVWARGPRY